jgi:hypothetical protein
MDECARQQEAYMKNYREELAQAMELMARRRTLTARADELATEKARLAEDRANLAREEADLMQAIGLSLVGGATPAARSATPTAGSATPAAGSAAPVAEDDADKDLRRALELSRLADQDAELQRALELSLADGDAALAAALAAEEAALAEDAEVARRLAAQEDNQARARQAAQIAEDARLALQVRKAGEEALTAESLGDVHQAELRARVEGPGLVRIGDRRYQAIECGSSHGAHSNLCGYLSLTAGNGPEAVALKESLAPIATAFARKIGSHTQTDFAGVATLADTEVIRAYVQLKKTPVCVYSAEVSRATSYYTDACVHDCVYLYLHPGHFQRLVPA